MLANLCKRWRLVIYLGESNPSHCTCHNETSSLFSGTYDHSAYATPFTSPVELGLEEVMEIEQLKRKKKEKEKEATA